MKIRYGIVSLSISAGLAAIHLLSGEKMSLPEFAAFIAFATTGMICRTLERNQ